MPLQLLQHHKKEDVGLLGNAPLLVHLQHIGNTLRVLLVADILIFISYLYM